LVSIGVLAIGLSGTTTVFSLFNGLFLKPFPVPHQERLVDLNETSAKGGGGYVGVQYRHFHAWREHNRTFETMAFCSFWASNLAGEGRSERARILLATHDLFRLLGVRPVLGRPFSAEEDRPGGPNVILLSYRIWERMFERSPEIIGRTVRLDNDPFTVIGILPPEATFPMENEVWRPLRAEPGKGHGGMGALALGRLKAGVTLQQARTDLAQIQTRSAEHHNDREATLPVVTGFRERYLREYLLGVRVVAGVVGFVLLIACCNVSSILLARGATRTKEVAMRMALGATRGRIVQHLLSESLVLSVLGTIFGVLLGYWALRAIVASLTHVIPVWLSFKLDFRFVFFAALLAAVVTGLSGLIPALQAARGIDLYASVRTLGTGTTHAQGRLRVLNAIVVGQIALALALLIGAGLFLQSLHRAQAVDPGFRPGGLLTYQIPLPIGPYFDEQKRQRFFEQHLEKVRALPGVEHATICNSLPCAFLNTVAFEVEGMPEPDRSGSDHAASKCSVMPDYFETMAITLVSGRLFSAWDNRREAERCVVIDESCARRFWPNAEALGQRLRPKGSAQWMRVIGVVQNVKNLGLDQLAWPTVYVPYVWDASFVTSGVVRTSRDPSALVSAIRELLRSADPEVPLIDVQTMSERIHKALWGERILAWLVGVPAVAAGLMACAGIFGVISYSVSQRTNEFGIRLALGAQPWHLMGLVLRAGIARIGLGVVLGVGLALGLTRVLRNLLFGIATNDPTTFVFATLLLGAVSVVAFWLPMRRAAKVDPMLVLRSE
jgi:predicted permease